MADGIRWVGLDAHARESTFAIFDQGTGEVITKRVVGCPHELLAWLRAVERPARMVYEAGPTGYGLARRALAEGIELGVCAPGKTERPPLDRVKTDKRDAVRLARLLAAVGAEEVADLLRLPYPSSTNLPEPDGFPISGSGVRCGSAGAISKCTLLSAAAPTSRLGSEWAE